MNSVFVDTAGWAALANKREVHHSEAKRLFNHYWNAGATLVTTTAVLSELTALLTRMRIPKTQQVDFIDDLVDDTSIQVIFIDSELNDAAWKFWRERLDKLWSYVDCSSFVVMNQNQLGEALTSDRHFEQAGYVRLIK